VKTQKTVTSDEWRVTRRTVYEPVLVTHHSSLITRSAFTLIEIMVVIALLSLIVIALMGVFNTTQAAFRASITQTDVLESGRAAMDLIAQDLKEMSPSFGQTNLADNNFRGTVNFNIANFTAYPALLQSLVGISDPSFQRTNIVENFFILSSGNNNGVPTWYGTGYAVYLSPTNFYSLYRFSTSRPMASANSASNLFYADFQNFLKFPNNTNYSRLMDGVVDLRVRAFDANGAQIVFNRNNILTNSMVFSGEFIPGEVGCLFYSNALPASVEVEMATLEDRSLQRAESLAVAGQSPSPSVPAQWQYLQNQAGKVHVFRQRVAIPNFDPAAYQ
jgi:type II secretory pathway pseudopilin PulG